MRARTATNRSLASTARWALLALAGWALAAWSGPPPTTLAYGSISLDGVPLGTAIAFRSSAPTIWFDAGTQRYHMWVQTQDETGSGATYADLVPLRLFGYKHAVSVDGKQFVSTGTLTFAGNPFATTIYGATFGEPPWIYPKVVFWNGRYKLLLWTFNDYIATPPPSHFGDYNYNISINDIGIDPNNLALVHEGPLGNVPANGIAGQTAGAFGLVNGVLYYDNNSLLGRAAISEGAPVAFPATAGTGPWRVTASNGDVFDLLAPLGLVACQFPGGNGYVHNDARVLANGNGTLGMFYSVRNCDGSRKYKQIFYIESADNGMTWSNPVGIFPDPAAVTINGSTNPVLNWSLSDVVSVNGQALVYFNGYDAAGNLLVAGDPPPVPVPPTQAIPALSWWMTCLLGLGLGFLGVRSASRKR